MPHNVSLTPQYTLIAATTPLLISAVKNSIVGTLPETKVHIAQDGLEAIDLTSKLSINFAILASNMEDIDGLDYIPRIANNAGIDRIIILADHHNPRALDRFYRLKSVSLFSINSSNPEDLKKCIDSTLMGHRYICSDLYRIIYDRDATTTSKLLSQSEEITLSLLGEGIDNEEAATRLATSPHSVRGMRARIMYKLGLRHKGELMRFAIKNGYTRFTNKGTLHPGNEKFITHWKRHHPA